VAEEVDMEQTATAQLSGQAWRRIVVVTAMVSAMVGGVAAVAGRPTVAEPSPGVLRLEAPATDPTCRELLAIPKRGWVCVHRRP
jgi:hypothetical protein